MIEEVRKELDKIKVFKKKEQADLISKALAYCFMYQQTLGENGKLEN